MFRKPYRVKTNTTMKGSDRRIIRGLIEKDYPNISQDDINAMIPNKSEMNQVKALSQTSRPVMIYYANSNPIFFSVDHSIYPTVYTLWKYINLLPTITTVPPVLEKICNGADLMAPGVVINEVTVKEMGDFKVDDICAVRILGNKAPIAVGLAAMSSSTLCTDDVKGKAVVIVHCFKDHIWASGTQIDPPLIPEQQLEDMCDAIEKIEISSENSVNTEEIKNDIPDNANNENQILSENENDRVNETDDNVMPEYTMDEILMQSFIGAIKVYGRKIQLPLLTSTFYSSYVLKSCPPELNLDIKKTTYKKLSVFLKKMVKEGILQIKELNKGVESIVSINLENDTLKSSTLDPAFSSHLKQQKVDKTKEDDSSTTVIENFKFPCVVELFVISAQVKKLFETANMKKGDSVPSSTVRDVIKLYVKTHSLQSEDNPREVKLDPLLSDCVLKRGNSKTTMTWEEIYEAVVHGMPHSYQITFDGKEPVVKKGKLEPIKIMIDTRTGNKKVTLIQNLEVYGINAEKIAHHVQVAVAASTSVSTTQNGKGTLVLIQGNQVIYLQKLFLDILKIPRKYIQGLENVPNKKK